jgi:hypothetical protein
MCYLSKPSNTSHFVPLFLADEGVVVRIAIFHIKLSTPRLACFIYLSLILQGSWSDHCNLNLKKEKKALLHGMWKLVGTRWNWLAMVWGRRKWGGVPKLYERAPMCQTFKELRTALTCLVWKIARTHCQLLTWNNHLSKQIFISVLQMKSSSTC